MFTGVLTLAIVLFILLILIFVFLFEIFSVTGAPYVPSRDEDVEKAFSKLYKLSSKDLLVDFGSGDGKILAAATAKGANAIGIEINPVLSFISKRRYKGNKNIKIIRTSMYDFELPKETTIIYLYGNTIVIKRVYEHLKNEAKRLKKDLYLLTNAFDQKDEKWEKHIAPYYLYKIKCPDSKNRGEG